MAVQTSSQATDQRSNVVYIVIDDMGFAATGAFGNDIIQTPNIDRLASEGLRYNNFHTTAICSATRASLLTGANHHKVGVASLVDFRGGKNNLGHIDHSYGTTAEILKESGYATFAVGKWHLSQDYTPAGPYDDWPLGRGFDRYYGVLPAMGDQFHPNLTQDNSFVAQPAEPDENGEGYHLSEDIIDHAIDYVFTEKTAFPDKPFFLYVAFGATHTPFHAPKSYIDAYKGKFHEGWDVLRRRWYENEKRLGVIPADAKLTERNELVPAWDELTDDEKRLAERYLEAYAGFLTHTDAQIGRLVDYLREIGQLDNTLLVLISDNGASGEGGRNGRFDSLRYAGGTSDADKDDEEIAHALDHIDEIGGEYSYSHYPAGWANALNTPFPWYKILTFEGGVKDDLIVRYPEGIADPGSVRGQYAHVSDVTPTVLESLGIEKPTSIKGVPQQPFTGTSFAYTFADANAADRKRVQYYEILGNRAIYKDGWKAVVNHLVNGLDYSKDEWELYHVVEDYSESKNVAAEYLDKLRELQDAFLVEAARNNVFPLLPGIGLKDEGTWDAANQTFKNEVLGKLADASEDPKRLVFHNIIKPFRLRVSTLDFAGGGSVDLDRKSHRILAHVKISAGDEGVIFSHGDRFGGFTLFVQDGKLHYAYNANRVHYYDAVSERALPTGELELGYVYTADQDAAGAKVELFVNGEPVGSTRIEDLYDQTGWPTEIKANHYTEVSPSYTVPFEFTGRIDEVRVEQIEDGSDPDGVSASERVKRDALHAD